jgi:hypothetical protein
MNATNLPVQTNKQAFCSVPRARGVSVMQLGQFPPFWFDGSVAPSGPQRQDWLVGAYKLY